MIIGHTKHVLARPPSHNSCWKSHCMCQSPNNLTIHLSRWVCMTSGSTSFTSRTWSSAFTPSSTRLQSSMRCSKLAGFWKSWNFVDTSRSFLCLQKWKYAIPIRMIISLIMSIIHTTKNLYHKVPKKKKFSNMTKKKNPNETWWGYPIA